MLVNIFFSIMVALAISIMLWGVINFRQFLLIHKATKTTSLNLRELYIAKAIGLNRWLPKYLHIDEREARGT